jgi:hypothetical protein
LERRSVTINMGYMLKFADLFAKGQQAQVDFLRTDLALCHTFADLAKTEFEINDPAGVQQAFSKAEDGYATMSRLLRLLHNPTHREEIEQGLRDLRTRLDELAPTINYCREP